MPWVIAPPTTGPTVAASPVTPPKTPIAQPRRSGGNAAFSSASASGMIIAAPAPCTARAAISQPTPGASAHAAEAAREQGQAGGEQPPPAEPVAERRGGHQQHGEAQRVGVDRPLELAEGRARSRRMVVSAVATTSRSSTTMNEADRRQRQHPALAAGRGDAPARGARRAASGCSSW